MPGKTTGLWGAAGGARMGRTRALDGTQRTADGKVSWTYHPDHGLNMVVEIKDDTPIPPTTAPSA